MPSLLDLALMRQNPTGAGLLGIGGPGGPQDGKALAQAGLLQGPIAPTVTVPAGAPAASAGPDTSAPASQGDGSFLQKLIAGGNDPNLSPAENERIKRQALLVGGLSALAGLGARDAGIPGLARAVLTGQQYAAGAKQEAEVAAKEANRERLRAEILSQGDLSTQAGRVSTVRSLLAAGFGDEAGKIIDVMGQFEAPQVLESGDTFKLLSKDGEITDSGLPIPAAPNGTDFQQIGDRLVLVDKQTGDEIKSWSNPDRLSAAELRAQSKDAFDQTTGLRKEFQTITGEGQEALSLADAALTGPEGSPATGQTIIIALNKILDPNSVVRESEFARVNDLGGYVARLEGMRAKFEKGQLGPTAEAEIRAEIARLRAAMAEGLSRQATFYTGLAAQNGLNPDQVVRPSLVKTLNSSPGDPLGELGGMGH